MDNQELHDDVKLAYKILMISHFVCFGLSFVIERLSVAANFVEKEGEDNFNKFVFLRKYLMLIKVLLMFLSVTNG